MVVVRRWFGKPMAKASAIQSYEFLVRTGLQFTGRFMGPSKLLRLHRGYRRFEYGYNLTYKWLLPPKNLKLGSSRLLGQDFEFTV